MAFKGLPDWFKAVWLIDQTYGLVNPATESTVTAIRSTIGGLIKLSFPPDEMLSDLNITSNTTLTDRIIQCKNLYVASGVTLTVPNGSLILVKYTAQIDGYLVPASSAVGGSGGAGSSYGGGAGGKGGDSGGIIVLVAGNVQGSGKIQANGQNGANGGAGASSPTGSASGSAGSAGVALSYLGGSTSGGAGGGGAGYSYEQ